MFQAATNGCPTSTPSIKDIDNGNGHLEDLLTNLISEIGKHSGHTMHKFRLHYTSRMPDVFVHQANVASLLGMCLNYEGQIWGKARSDVSRLVDHAFDSMDPDQGRRWVRPRTGDRRFDRDGRGAGRDRRCRRPVRVRHERRSRHPEQVRADQPPQGRRRVATLAGYEADAIIDSIEHSLAAINSWIKAHEGAVRDAFHDAGSQMHADFHAFDLTRPSVLDEDLAESTDPESAAILVAGSKGQLHINAADLRDVIRDDLHPIAGQLDASRTMAESGLGTDGAWIRDDGVGLGATGPRDTWMSLAERHDRVLDATADQIREAANHLRIATEIIKRADEQVNAALAADTRRLHHAHH